MDSFEKFDGQNWMIFRKKVAAHAIKIDETNKSNCYDIIQFAEVRHRLRGKPPAAGSADAHFLAKFAKLKDLKKRSAQNLVYSFLAMSSIDSCPGIVYAVDERLETCGSDLWMHFLSAFEPKPRSAFSQLCSVIYHLLSAVMYLIIFKIKMIFLLISLFLGFVIFSVEILLDIIRALIEALYILGIPRLRPSSVPR